MSYGKFFASCFTGSMVGSGPTIFAVWGYVIANTIDGQVELNPIILSTILGAPVEEIQTAIDKLCAPDPRSRNKLHDGRRLIKEGEYAYVVVSHFIYRAMRNEDERREYNRIKKREQRSKEKASKASLSVNDMSPMSSVSAQAEAEAEADISPLPSLRARGVQGGNLQGEPQAAQAPRSKAEKFVKPTVEEMALHCAKIGLPGSELQKFINHYEANGWRTGRNPMKSWRHALQNWKINYDEGRYTNGSAGGRKLSISEQRNSLIAGADETSRRIREEAEQPDAEPPFH